MSGVLEGSDVELLQEALGGLREMLSRKKGDMDRELVTKLRRLFNAESAGLFYQPSDRVGYIRLAASEPKEPTDSLEFKISSEKGRGMTGALALLNEVTTYDFQTLRSHPSLAGGTSSHLIGGTCYSLLAIPLRNHQRFLMALLKFENKLGSGGCARPEDSFSETDMLLARLVRHTLEILVEASMTRAVLLNLSRFLSQHE